MARDILKLPKLTTAEAALLKEDHDAVELAFDNQLDLVKVSTSGGTVESVATATNTLTLTNKTLTAPTIAGSLGTLTVTSAITTNPVTAAQSGTVFMLNLAAGFVSTLPAPASGLWYRFYVGTAPTPGNYTVVTTSSANLIAGRILTVDVNSGTDPSFDDDADTITFVASKALPGDFVEVVSDGTSWFAWGVCSVFDAITITKAS